MASFIPSWPSRLRDQSAIPGSNSGSIQTASSAWIRWIVPRMTHARTSERSSMRARSTSAAVRRALRERKESRPARASCA